VCGGDALFRIDTELDSMLKNKTVYDEGSSKKET